jgi:hypothetical protein
MNDSHPEIGEKVSKALKEGYASGELTHPWTGKHHSEETKEKIREAHKGKFDGQKNPMFAKKHSDYSRNKMSCTKAQKIVNGESNVHLRGKIYCSKIDKEVIYRSSWEKIVLESLDMSTDVSWFSVEPFSVVYLYDRKRRYTPDLLIRYTDSTRPLVLVEIKPSYFIKAAINQAKFKAAEEYCKEKGFIFEVWTEEKIKELARLLNQTQET